MVYQMVKIKHLHLLLEPLNFSNTENKQTGQPLISAPTSDLSECPLQFPASSVALRMECFTWMVGIESTCQVEQGEQNKLTPQLLSNILILWLKWVKGAQFDRIGIVEFHDQLLKRSKDVYLYLLTWRQIPVLFSSFERRVRVCVWEGNNIGERQEVLIYRV